MTYYCVYWDETQDAKSRHNMGADANSEAEAEEIVKEQLGSKRIKESGCYNFKAKDVMKK